jgi:hypothetical protein
MTDSGEQNLQRAITTLAQSDPLIKLLKEVTMGRKQPTDAGIRAVTESWLVTYRKVFEDGARFSPSALRRLDPTPRVRVLLESGILSPDHTAVAALQAAYERALSDAEESSASSA